MSEKQNRYYLTSGYYILYRPSTDDIVLGAKSGRKWFTCWTDGDTWYAMDGSPFEHGWISLGEL